MGLKVFTGEFYALAVPLRAQHSVSLRKFIKTGNISSGSFFEQFLPMQEGQSVLNALAKYFLNCNCPEQEKICLDIGGNQENVSIMLKRVLPFLSEIIKESKRKPF
jgi:hypothetical protein